MVGISGSSCWRLPPRVRAENDPRRLGHDEIAGGEGGLDQIALANAVEDKVRFAPYPVAG
jgi:hypothetical protein